MRNEQDRRQSGPKLDVIKLFDILCKELVYLSLPIIESGLIKVRLTGHSVVEVLSIDKLKYPADKVARVLEERVVGTYKQVPVELAMRSLWSLKY